MKMGNCLLSEENKMAVLCVTQFTSRRSILLALRTITEVTEAFFFRDQKHSFFLDYIFLHPLLPYRFKSF
jgi:hypothetical protein